MQLDHRQVTTVTVAMSGPQDEDMAFRFLTVGRDCGGRGMRREEMGQEEETKLTKREIPALIRSAQ